MLIAKDMYNADQTRKEAERSYTVYLYEIEVGDGNVYISSIVTGPCLTRIE